MITTTNSQNDSLAHELHLNYKPYFNNNLNMAPQFSQENTHKNKDLYVKNGENDYTAFNMNNNSILYDNIGVFDSSAASRISNEISSLQKVNSNFLSLIPSYLPSINSTASSKLLGSNQITDYEILKQDYLRLSQKLNYIMNSIQTFWSPELKKERQLRKEELIYINTLQRKLGQQAAEINVVKKELEKREKDISQLISESDLVEMDEELYCLQKKIQNESVLDEGRDFTDKIPTLHELQTAKTKMECSELTLSKKNRDLKNCEVRLKCAKEQNNELEKQNKFFMCNNVANEAQIKLLHDDLDVLRKKLETKNQLLESREQFIKSLEKELETTKSHSQEQTHIIKENKHKIIQIKYRIDQLETLLRDKDLIADRLKQRLMQCPDTRAEAELQQKIENIDKDKENLEKTIDTLRQNSEIEKQNQLQLFQVETQQLRLTINHLQKELSDRHMLIASQNEKISQMDAEFGKTYSHNLLTLNYNRDVNDESNTNNADRKFNKNSETNKIAIKTLNLINNKKNELIENELDEARTEIDNLLRIVHQLEKDKNILNARLNNIGISSYESKNWEETSTNLLTKIHNYENQILLEKNDDLTTLKLTAKTENSALKLRIEALEEALRESVGITSERDRVISNQKQLIQQLSNQVTELYKNCRGKDLQKTLLDAFNQSENAEKALLNERLKFQSQLSSLQKEIIMTVIREKEFCIQLLQSPPDSIKEKIKVLIKQKEQLKHRLLTTTGSLGTTSIQENFTPSLFDLDFLNSNLNSISKMKASEQNEHESNNLNKYITILNSDGFAQNIQSNNIPPPIYTTLAPISINVPSFNATIGYSAPASLTYEKDKAFEDDGIWA